MLAREAGGEGGLASFLRRSWGGGGVTSGAASRRSPPPRSGHVTAEVRGEPRAGGKGRGPVRAAGWGRGRAPPPETAI